MSAGPVLIMAGGTGGHVYPALAVARELLRREREVVWLGTRRGLEARVVPESGIAIEWLSVKGLRGKGWQSWLVAPLELVRAVTQALAVIRRRRPDAVLGMGGFVAGPGGLAAWLTRRPLVIHEQNAVAGLTNRLLARFARVVLEAFPGTFSSRARVRTVGNPVRREIAALPPPAERLAARDGPLRLLVLGGSLGALALNRQVPAALQRFGTPLRPVVRHQAGARTFAAAVEAYASAGVDADIVPFIDDMAEAYAWADCVICRAGALTVAEVNAAGLGAVFVPFPHAVDDHQTANAAASVAAGAAVLLQERAMTAEALAGALSELGAGREALTTRAERARELAAPAALADIADVCLSAAEQGR
ncbi:MAG: undecaprenyldiphospho-muramoylpentapeptide beta-N-acetylglucosaminyltransferase [Pseudomonadota bacterium]